MNVGNEYLTHEKKRLIEVVDVLKEENSACSCDKEFYWVKYKIEAGDLKGILTLKYENPCCK